MKSFEILGLGTALPEHSISQAGMATFATTCVAPELTGSKNPSGLIQALYRRAGVQSSAMFLHRPLRTMKQLPNVSSNSSKVPKIAARELPNA